MTDSDRPTIVKTIPAPSIIRARLDELRREARILRQLLNAADTRERLDKREVARAH